MIGTPRLDRALAAGRPGHGQGRERLLVVHRDGGIEHARRHRLPAFLRPGDLLVANDAATVPGSLAGRHARSGEPIEIRLAGAPALESAGRFVAVIFGAGDHRQRTEDRPAPPRLAPGDRLILGPLEAVVERTLGHPRLVLLRFVGSQAHVWRGLALHGRPVQYAHQPAPLALWDVWTALAVRPVAFEPPSAGFVLDWDMLDRARAQGIGFATLTHAAGLSSTGDAALDARLPLDEPYEIPDAAVDAIATAKRRGARVVAIGTTVVRALEHAGAGAPLPRAGPGVADQRIGAHSRLSVVDAIVTGVHEPGTSHHDLLQAFVDDARLRDIDAALLDGRYRTHEFGDFVYVERQDRAAR